MTRETLTEWRARTGGDCDCDEDVTCAYHEAECPICERPKPDGSMLCPRCEATAKAGGKQLHREQDWIGQEGAGLR